MRHCCRSLLLALGLLACTHAPSPSPAAEDSGEVAFVGVTVVPMDTERRVPDQTVVVRHGRIAEIENNMGTVRYQRVE
jgi:hypothetical protein